MIVSVLANMVLTGLILWAWLTRKKPIPTIKAHELAVNGFPKLHLIEPIIAVISRPGRADKWHVLNKEDMQPIGWHGVQATQWNWIKNDGRDHLQCVLQDVPVYQLEFVDGPAPLNGAATVGVNGHG